MEFVLHTERLTLRPLTAHDLDSAYAYLGDKTNCPYMMFLPHDTAAETLDYLKEAEAEWGKEIPRHLHFAVLRDNIHIGEVFIYIAGTLGELGWIIRSDFCGKGYAFEAAEALKNFALQHLKLMTLVAHCDTRNIASERIMQKLGMELHERGTRENRACPGVTADEVGSILKIGEI